MPDSREQSSSPGEDYFNDLSQQPKRATEEGAEDQSLDAANGSVPKPKRIACVLCRKRKLRCDGNKPSCGTCARLQHECSYDEVRKKSGPKRGYVKALEARLAQVETLLHKTDSDVPPRRASTNTSTTAPTGAAGITIAADLSDTMSASGNLHGLGTFEQSILPSDPNIFSAAGLDGTGAGLPSDEPFPWEMIGLGLDEPLPTPDVVAELNQLYFEKVQPVLPMIHRPRYYAAMNLPPHLRPPVCLRYAMWTYAASVTDKYEGLAEHFYTRARKYVQQDEMRGHGEGMITLGHCQAWLILASYEFKTMYFPRAWMSSGRATRMAQMMGLHRLDGQGLDVKQCLPPPKDWTEREERRRTFWMAFCIDRYSSIGTGWPMTIEERDILSVLPAEDDAYELSRAMKTVTLKEALDPNASPDLSGFAGVVMMACLFGRNLTHLHRPSPEDNDDDLNGEFWKRHRSMDNILLHVALGLPDPLRLPTGLSSPNIVWLNMNIHTSTICLHQAAIFKADKNRMPPRISAESKIRCITAAAEIANIMRQVCHMDLTTMNPFMSFCLYVAARVFVQYLKSRPNDEQVRTSLQFLLSAMQAIKRRNPLTESFLVQLDVDLESAGLGNSGKWRNPLPDKSNLPFAQQKTPAYGDNGLASYNVPNHVPLTSSVPSSVNRQVPLSDFSSAANLSQDSPMDFMSTTQAFELPSRQRSPGSSDSSNLPRVPLSFVPEMDITPDDGSGRIDSQSPSGSTPSQHNTSTHTSNTTYTPPRVSQTDQASANPPSQQQNPLLHTDFTDFDFHTFTNVTSQQASTLPIWATAAFGTTELAPDPIPTGFTPGPSSAPSGLTPGASGMSEFMNMSEAEWNQMVDTMNVPNWDTNLEPSSTMQESMLGRRS